MANNSVNIDLSGLPYHTNDIYFPAFYNESRFLVFMGGGGSGKSKFCAAKVIMRTLMEKNSKIGCVRKVASRLRESVFANLRQVIFSWKLDKYFEFNKTDLKIICTLNGNQILCVGMDDSEKIKSIDMVTSWWVEEATELREEELDQLNIRLRGKQDNYKQIMLSFNPISVHHWLKSKFFDTKVTSKSGPGFRYKHRKMTIDLGAKSVDLVATTLVTTYKDNRFLSDEDAAQLESLKFTNKRLYDVYANGMWGTTDGLVYEMPNIIPLSQFPRDSEFTDLFYGLDFGYNAPSVIAKVGIKVIQNIPHVFLHQCLYQAKLTNPEFIKTFPLHIKHPGARGNKGARICADSASPERIEEIKKAGWNITPAIKGTGSIVDGVDFVISLFPNVYISDVSVDGIKEFSFYTWPKNKEDRNVDDVPTGEDHFLDAIRYPLYTFYNKNKGKGAFSSLTNWRQ